MVFLSAARCGGRRCQLCLGLGDKFLTLSSNALTNLNLSDMECCYKVFRRDILEQLDFRENRFGIEPEITAKISRLPCRIYEVGVSYAGRTYAEGKRSAGAMVCGRSAVSSGTTWGLAG